MRVAQARTGRADAGAAAAGAATASEPPVTSSETPGGEGVTNIVFLTHPRWPRLR